MAYVQTACPHCDSSDAYTIYDDGAYCFSCQYSTKKKEDNMKDIIEEDNESAFTFIEDIATYKSFPISSRKISQQVVDYFNVKMSINQDGKPGSHFYPYTKDGQVVAYKERILPKDFRTHGDFKKTELFGQAQAIGSKTLVITEGELDCMAVAEAFVSQYKDRIFPVVSLPSATGTRALLDQREWVNQFDSVILMLDNDEAGKKSLDACAKIIGAGKVKVASLRGKDPCESLYKYGPQSILQAIWGAQKWSPAGIMVGDDIWTEFKSRQETESIPYPDCLDGINSKVKGIRQGEITLFTSGTGSGKSTVIKEIVLDLLEKTNDKIGLISLEESVGDTAEKFISMQLQRPVMDPPPLTDKELRVGFDAVFGDDRLVLLDHQGSVGDSSLTDKIEYMALMGCKYLVLDHITIAVSEGTEGLSGNEAIDKMMSDLLKIVKKHNVWLGLISHLRKSQSGASSFEEGKFASIDDIKGSGSIKQISFDIISFARNLVADDDLDRNTIRFRVLKSRFTGLTGNAGAAVYDINTTRLNKLGDGFEFQTGTL
jgi:twinkle protein